MGFDDIMGEESAADIMAPLEEEEHHHMSPGQSLDTDQDGDIISDIERIQRALTGDSKDVTGSLNYR